MGRWVEGLVGRGLWVRVRGGRGRYEGKHRRRRTQPFGYYTDMVQQIKFIIHANIKPLPANFFTQGQGQKKILVNAIT